VVPTFLIALNSMLDTRYRDESALRLVINKSFLAALIVMIVVMINETIIATAQEKQMNASNSTNLEKPNIVVTWIIKTNDTKTSDAPVVSVSSEDFWMIFEPLLKQSINDSTSSLE
jgi:hypothetical protein